MKIIYVVLLLLFLLGGLGMWQKEQVLPVVIDLVEPKVPDLDQGDTTKTETSEVVSDTVAAVVPPEGILLSSLGLGETERNFLAAAQIEVDTFVITRTMVVCAEEKLGEVRMAELLNGDRPSLLELGKVLPCLS